MRPITVEPKCGTGRHSLAECGQRFGPDDVDRLVEEQELIRCPECGGELWNLTTPSRE
ncbi:MAG: hypothetical protein ABEJ23_02475 [Haloarculaceae archaeon]